MHEFHQQIQHTRIGVVKLVVESKEQVANSAKRLIQQVQQQLIDEAIQNNMIDLIETIVIYKLPQKSRREIEVMLGLDDLKKTKFYQEAYQDGEQIGEMKAKLEAIPELIKEGLTLEQISRVLKLPLEVIQQTSIQ